MDKRVEKIYDYIKRHYAKKILLGELAYKAKLSPYYFQRLFKKEMNETPAECINRVRLKRARHLLKAGSSFSIAQIAEDCGFSSPAVFNRAFKQQFKMAPGVFQKSTEHSMVVVLQKEKVDAAEAEIIYLPDIYVYGVSTSITNENLITDIDAVKEFCKQNNISIEGRKMGILTHNTFHDPEAKNNYYIGVSVDANTAGKYSDQLFFIPKGRFACFTTTESLKKAREVLMQFIVGWMDKSHYTWRELIAYEEFLPENKDSDYPFLKRRVYVPVRRK